VRYAFNNAISESLVLISPAAKGEDFVRICSPSPLAAGETSGESMDYFLSMFK
jgi:hypothetical protein